MRIIFVTLSFLLSGLAFAGANCPTMSLSNTVEKYPYPDHDGFYAALNFFDDTNANGAYDEGVDVSISFNPNSSLNKGCMIMGSCPIGYANIIQPKYAEEAADSTCTSMVDASARTLSLAQFTFNKAASTCSISTFTADFSACEKIYWSLCRKESSGHDCYDGDFVGSSTTAGVFPSHVLTAYSYIYNYGHSVGGGGGGGKGGGGGNLCKLVSGAWSCD